MTIRKVMKWFQFIFIFLFVGACSHHEQTARVPSRMPASFLSSCSEIAKSLFAGKGTLTRKLSRPHLKLQDLMGEVADSEEIFGPDHLKLLEKSKLLDELQIKEGTLKELAPYVGSPVRELGLKELLSRLITERLSAHENITEEINYLSSIYDSSGATREFISDLWQRSSFYHRGLRVFSFKKNFHLSLLHSLKLRSEEARELYGLLELTELLYRTKFNQEEYDDILNASPYYHFLTKKNKALALSIEDGLKENSGVYNDELMKNLLTSLGIVEAHSLDKMLAEDINCGYAFAKTIERMAREPMVGDGQIIKLEQSRYASRVGIDQNNIYQMILRLREIPKTELTIHSVVKDLESQFEVFRNGSKKVLSIDSYDSEIQALEVKDQCGWGSCWLHAALSKAEIEIAKNHDLENPVTLSVDYLYSYYLKNEYKSMLETNGESLKIRGAHYSLYQTLVENYGLIPTSVWKAPFSLHNGESAAYIKKVCEQVVTSYRKQIGEVKLKSEKERLIKEARLKIDQVIHQYIGPIPSTFQFAGREYTPQSFSKEFSPASHEESYLATPQRSGKAFSYYSYRLHQSYDVSEVSERLDARHEIRPKDFDDLLDTIVKSVDEKRAAAISVNWLESEQGTKFLDIHSNLTVPGDFTSTQLEKKSSYHAILIVAYEKDIHGRPVRFKVLNSWGEAKGQSGFYHIHRDYLFHFLSGIYLKTSDDLAYYLDWSLLPEHLWSQDS